MKPMSTLIAAVFALVSYSAVAAAAAAPAAAPAASAAQTQAAPAKKANLQKVTQEVFELERSLNERWSAGDNRGYLDNYHQDISYFDPVVKHLLVGRDAVVEHLQKLYKNPHIVRSEYLNPHVITSEAGDLAVLSYNLRSYVVDANGTEQLLRAWNATEVYRKIAGAWRIVHSNWAITQSMTTPSAS